MMLSVCGLCFGAPPVLAQTLTDSLAAAYSTNSQLNYARAQLRSIDEGVAIAKSGNRPVLSSSFSALANTTETNGVLSSVGGKVNGGRNNFPATISVTLTQPIFNGFQTRNNILAAEANVRATRQSLRNTEQTVLLSAATAFYNVVTDKALVNLNQNNVKFLREQVRAAQDRYQVGEGTRTDVSQAEARLADAQASLNSSLATLASDEATFRQVTGLNVRNLVSNFKVEKLIPPTLDSAVLIGQDEHPAIQASVFNVDVALYNEKVQEGKFLPQVSAQGSLSAGVNGASQTYNDTESAQIGVSVTMPIYQGGLASAQVRQSKENLGAARIQVDQNRDAVRQAIVSQWAFYQSAIASIRAAQTGVFAQQLALQGVIEEQKVGQRTTLDVLNAQQDLITAQVTLVQAQKTEVEAAFNLVSAIGRLNAQHLSLKVAAYRPAQHYLAVRDKWFGLRTPDGR